MITQSDDHFRQLVDQVRLLDLSRSDARAGAGRLIRHIEERVPGLVQQIAAEQQLRSLGVRQG